MLVGVDHTSGRQRVQLDISNVRESIPSGTADSVTGQPHSGALAAVAAPGGSHWSPFIGLVGL